MMGGDSAASNEDGDQTLRSPKVFERRAMLFGVSGEMRIGQLLHHVYDVPAINEGQDLEQFIVRDLCCGLRGFLHKHAEELLPGPDDEEIWNLLVRDARKSLSHLFTLQRIGVGYKLRCYRFGYSSCSWILGIDGRQAAEGSGENCIASSRTASWRRRRPFYNPRPLKLCPRRVR